MLNLTDRSWNSFKVVDILGRAHNAKAYHSEALVESDVNEHDGIAYITRTSLNNGLFSIVQQQDNFLENPKNSISLGAENARYFYQPYKYITGNKMYFYKVNVFSKYTLLFLVNCLNKSINGCGFGYGMGLTGTRSDTRTFMLPVDKKGNPDYVFMERYIRNLIKHKRDEYRRFLNKQTNKQEWLPSKKWEKFKIKDITLNGKISTGAYVSKAKLHSGTTPRITVTSVNNGVDGFYSCTDKNYRCHNNFISVSFLGDCFYHGYLASLDMKVHSLQFKDYKLTPCVALFMVACLKNNTKVHSYGNQLSSTDLPMKNILLPKNEVTGLPDYEFMEKYVMNIVLRKYTSYLDFILRN